MNIVTYGLFSDSPVVSQLERLPNANLTTLLDYLDERSLHHAHLVVSAAAGPSEIRPLCGKLYQSLQSNPDQQVLLIGEQSVIPIPLRPLAQLFERRFHTVTESDAASSPAHIQAVLDLVLPCAA